MEESVEPIRKLMDRYYHFWFGVNALYDEWARWKGLTVNSLFTLFQLYESEGGCTQQQIADKLQQHKQTVSALLDKMEERGYICRLTRENDRRSKRVTLTEEGRALAGSLRENLSSVEVDVLGNMTPLERAGMVDGSERFLFLLRERYQKEKDRAAAEKSPQNH